MAPITIDRASNVPLYQQIYASISADIMSGKLAAHDKLPGIRDLAAELAVARNTVETAYRQLLVEGFVTSKRGVGYIVEDLEFPPVERTATPSSHATWSLGAAGLGRNPLGETYDCAFDFCYGNQNPERIPTDILRQLFSESLSDPSQIAAASYGDPDGLPALRLALARHLKLTRGVRCRPEQIVIQPGTQNAIARFSALFPNDERVVAMEEPGYDAARAAFAHNGYRIVGIPMWRNAHARQEALQASGARLVFCTPSNQFPLGYITPLKERLGLIRWAENSGAYVIEDDYCCEFRYNSNPVPSMQSLDPSHVVYIGTLSKILSPALRLSFMVLPPKLLKPWQERYRETFSSVPWITQDAMRRFLERDDWARHVRSMTAAARKTRDVLISSLGGQMGSRITVIGGDAGLHVLVEDKMGRDQHELIERARQNGVRVYETDRYWMRKRHPLGSLVLMGFSSIAADDIPEGVRRLNEAWYG